MSVHYFNIAILVLAPNAQLCFANVILGTLENSVQG